MKVRLRLSIFSIVFSVFHSAAFIQNGDSTERFLVVRASPETKQQLAVLRELHDNMNEYEIDFWLTPTAIGHKADMMIHERREEWLKSHLTAEGIPYIVSINDVQQLIIDREHKPTSIFSLLQVPQFFKRLHDEGGNKAKYGFGEYHSYDHIIQWMNDIERLYPDKAKVITIGTTVEGKPIKTIKIGTAVARTDKRIVWLDGGIHAREWAAVHTTLYILDRLIADYDTDPLVQRAVDSLNFYVTPVLNPDGYEFSRSGVSPLIRLWRKNRSAMVCKKDRWFRERCCGGVDLNRNFDWFWGEIGSSSDRCSEIYQGSAPFSEAEARAVRDTMFSPDLKGKVDAFITLHTYSQMWIHPFSHQRKTVPEDISDIEQVGRRAVSALENVFGTKYRFGTGADILYPSSGGSDDWAKGKGGAKYVYLIELRPGEEVWDGFILDSRQLIPTGKETWAGIKVVIEAVLDRIKREPRPMTTIAPKTTQQTTRSVIGQIISSSMPTTQWRQAGFTRPRHIRPSTNRLVVVSADAQTSSIKERLRQQQNQLDLMRQRAVQRGKNKRRRGGKIRIDDRQGAKRVAGHVEPNKLNGKTLVDNGDSHSSMTPCFDRSPWCSAWIQKDSKVCTVSSVYMKNECTRSCRFC